MNNRYTYRGKSIETGKWIYGSLIIEKGPLQCFANESSPDKYYIGRSGFADWNMPRPFVQEEVGPNTVGQCTGRKDTEGVLVYEGDKVLADRANSRLENKDMYVVEWSEQYDMWVLRIIKSDNPNRVSNIATKANGQPYILSNVKLVVGNIIDNGTE